MPADSGYLEIIDARTHAALITGEGADYGSFKENKQQYYVAKQLYAVDRSKGQWLVDLHDANGDLVDTFNIDRAGFKALTGHAPKSISTYKKIDQAFWQKAKALAL